jgi:hypothetical protein
MANNQRVGPTAEQAEEFLTHIRAGKSAEAAAAKAGFSRRAFRSWREKGLAAWDKEEAGGVLDVKEQWLRTFVEEFEMAEGVGEFELHEKADRLADEGKGTWTQPVTVMQRRWPDRWSEKRPLGELSARVEIVIEGRPVREVQVVEGHAEEDRRALPAAPSAAGVSE